MQQREESSPWCCTWSDKHSAWASWNHTGSTHPCHWQWNSPCREGTRIHSSLGRGWEGGVLINCLIWKKSSRLLTIGTVVRVKDVPIIKAELTCAAVRAETAQTSLEIGRLVSTRLVGYCHIVITGGKLSLVSITGENKLHCKTIYLNPI